MSGSLSKLANTAQTELTDILSEIEVSFDYPEETIEYITKAKVKERLVRLEAEIAKVLATASAGKIIKSGINVLIVGKPNVGKSTLMNLLAKSDVFAEAFRSVFCNRNCISPDGGPVHVFAAHKFKSFHLIFLFPVSFLPLFCPI